MRIFNTATAKVEEFNPFDKNCVRVYVCGPTVYDRIHIGNARSIIVFDTLVAHLRRKYKKVIYVRNITDVDDKIIARAYDEKITTQKLTARMTELFQQDADALFCAKPELEPKATEHIDEMIELIKILIKNKNAYATDDGHVLFAIKSFPQYGALAKRTGKLEQQLEGERALALECKRAEGDFVLWKPQQTLGAGYEASGEAGGEKAGEAAGCCDWDSPWGRGRPGWHVECSAMSRLHLGAKIDIHGGGQDLIFPHHENEIAQSRAAHPQEPFVKYWVHNGYLLANGQKMAKSRGNFHLVCDLLKHVSGEAIRLTLLRAHYRQPLNFSSDRLHEAEKNLDKLYTKAYQGMEYGDALDDEKVRQSEVVKQVKEALDNDLNTPLALAAIFSFADKISYRENEQNVRDAKKLIGATNLLGLLKDKNRITVVTAPFDRGSKPRLTRGGRGDASFTNTTDYSNTKIHEGLTRGVRDSNEQWIKQQVSAREQARASGDFALADKIRAELEKKNITIEDAKINQ